MKFQDYLKPFSTLILLGSIIFFIACTEDTDVPIDDEIPAFQIDITKTQDGKEGGAAVIYTISLSEGSSVFTNILDEAVSMSIDFTNGSDADQDDLSTSFPTTVSIPVGSSSATVTLQVASDNEEEETETLRATISGASSGAIGTASADASITDATFQIDITKTQDGKEGGAAVIYTISLSEGSSVFTNILDEAVSMSIDFTNGSDADQDDLSTSFPTTVSIPVGSSSTTITLEVASDDEEEETETLRATISGASSGAIETASADASITDATEGSTADNDVSVLEKYFYTSNTTFVVNETTITITTKDLPDHKSMYYPTDNALYEAYDEPDNADFKKNPGEIEEQDIVLTIPRFPELDPKHSSPGLGPFGVAINSVVFFNQEAAPGDDIFDELNTFDQYEGHPAGTTYHYHIKPVWLTELKGSDAFMGFLLDGFPVYGPFENGKEIFNNDLDDYHGHTSATADFPNGIYHYHITEEYPWINGDGYYGTPGTKSN